MRADRILQWEGCWNVRDLGGLPLAGGGETRFGAVVRSDDPCKLTAAGWRALEAHGVRTVVSLQTLGAERDDADAARRPDGIATVRVHVEDFGDEVLVARLNERFAGANVWSTPLYYPDALERWPERSAAALRAVANAPTGGVLVHCGVGRDRTGLVALLMLALVGVSHDAIVRDFEESYRGMAAAGRADELGEIDALLEREGVSAGECIRSTLAAVDVEACLRAGGLRGSEIRALRERLAGRSG